MFFLLFLLINPGQPSTQVSEGYKAIPEKKDNQNVFNEAVLKHADDQKSFTEPENGVLTSKKHAEYASTIDECINEEGNTVQEDFKDDFYKYRDREDNADDEHSYSKDNEDEYSVKEDDADDKNGNKSFDEDGEDQYNYYYSENDESENFAEADDTYNEVDAEVFDSIDEPFPAREGRNIILKTLPGAFQGIVAKVRLKLKGRGFFIRSLTGSGSRSCQEQTTNYNT